MKKLTNTQKQYLRRMAQVLRPVVQIGKNGLTDQVHTTVDQELNTHELIKVKFVDFKDEKKELTEELVACLELQAFYNKTQTAVQK